MYIIYIYIYTVVDDPPMDSSGGRGDVPRTDLYYLSIYLSFSFFSRDYYIFIRDYGLHVKRQKCMQSVFFSRLSREFHTHKYIVRTSCACVCVRVKQFNSLPFAFRTVAA